MISKSKFFFEDEEPVVKEVVEEVKKVVEDDHKYCKQCSTANNRKSKFCFECGGTEFFDSYEELQEFKNFKYCLACGLKISRQGKFCPECGGNKFADKKEDIRKIRSEEKIQELNNEIKKCDSKIYELNKAIDKLESEKVSLNKKITDIREAANNMLDSEIDELDVKFDALQSKIDEIKSDTEFLRKEYTSDKELKEISLSEKAKLLESLKLEVESLKGKISQPVSTSTESISSVEKTPPVKTKQRMISSKNLYFQFGTYNNEPITWRFVYKTDDEIMVIAKDCLDAYSQTEVQSNRDKILNTFYNNCFNAEEKKFISPKNGLHLGFITEYGAYSYLIYKYQRQCGFNKTAGAKAKLVNGEISWWISGCKKIINPDGDFVDVTNSNERHGFRPVFFIKKSYFK